MQLKGGKITWDEVAIALLSIATFVLLIKDGC